MTTNPTTRTTLFLGATAAVAATALGTLGFAQHPTEVQNHGNITASSIQTVDTLEEDELGWDCATMGNKICGPTPDLTDPANWCTLDGAGIIVCPVTQRVDILYPVR